MTNYILKLRKVLAHRVVKRLAVAIPIGVGAGLLYAYLEGASVLIEFFVGVGSYVLSDWLLSTKSERQARIQRNATLLRKHRMTAMKWGMYILTCVCFFNSRSEPSEPAVKQVLFLVQTFGFVAVLGTIIPAIWGAWSSVTGMISRFLRGLSLYSTALWLIGEKGDALYKWDMENPNDAPIAVAALIIIWMIVRFSGGVSLGSESIVKSSGAAAMAAGVISPKPTERDSRYIAAHEAGHALVYAALGGLPADVKLAVNDHSDERGVLGFVTGVGSKHILEEKSFAEWYMLVFLAGKFGEAFMHGESTLGSSNDHLRWLIVARSYLANHYRGIYYTEPENKFEQRQNEVKLDVLQAEQLAILRTLFETNAEVFQELTDTLLEKRAMGREDLSPLLSRVNLPTGFPRPFGEFKTFTTDR